MLEVSMIVKRMRKGKFIGVHPLRVSSSYKAPLTDFISVLKWQTNAGEGGQPMKLTILSC